MKMDQVAFYAPSDADEARIKDWFGLTDAVWIEDRVTAASAVQLTPGHHVSGVNVAKLLFNYDLGIELEIIRYLDGPNWIQSRTYRGAPITHGLPFINHIGLHLEDTDDFPPMTGAVLVQETFTTEHTSKYLTDPDSPGFGRKYHYKIWETVPGSYIKFIKRIHPQ